MFQRFHFWRSLAVAITFIISLAVSGRAEENTLSLAGTWRFSMGGPSWETAQKARPTLTWHDNIELPGTTETRHKGPVHGAGWSGTLTRVYKYEGPAYYERDLTIPPQWRGKTLSLFLERTKPTLVWIDDRALGENVILCTAHEYALGTLLPGRHRLTILVDNSQIPIPGDMHQLSDNTQGNWNGLLGKLEIHATDAVWLQDVQVKSDAAHRTIHVRTHLGNTNHLPGQGTLLLTASGQGVDGARVQQKVSWTSEGGLVETDLPLGRSAALWDEFHPNLLLLTVHLVGSGVSDERKISFGLRDFTSGPSGFRVNGRATFLRGKHDACVFPLTGHPPMDVAGWRHYLTICRNYGINHIRFHSWIPPDAAFSAADELGMYLQPELPFWGEYNDDIKARLKPEAIRIIDQFGNHPSFVMLSMGNETRGSREVMASLVNELRAIDSRHLYVQGSNAYSWDPQLPASDDYLTSAAAKNGPQSPSRDVRGANATPGSPSAHVQAGPANTLTDYSAAIAGIAKPVIGHEIGQYTSYPDFRQNR